MSDELEVDVYGKLACDIITTDSKYRSIDMHEDYELVDTNNRNPVSIFAMDSSRVSEMINESLPSTDNFENRCRSLSVFSETFSEKLKTSNLLTHKNKPQL